MSGNSFIVDVPYQPNEIAPAACPTSAACPASSWGVASLTCGTTDFLEANTWSMKPTKVETSFRVLMAPRDARTTLGIWRLAALFVFCRGREAREVGGGGVGGRKRGRVESKLTQWEVGGSGSSRRNRSGGRPTWHGRAPKVRIVGL